MRQTLLAAIIILTLAFSTPAQRTDKPQAEIRPVKVKIAQLKEKPRQRLLLRVIRIIAWTVFHRGAVRER